ncbi:hypothetical protein FA15DRAFT_660464 [Coprinopsis marcescibilis]|uniref:Uncharacterized protein n=1 Tax=Coprinopsis marcescibilis TaxID=230819 RepID=A0A5C3KF89_COPMA|nr:hypothetical protein FA15DRAFT_660464 [Coprinopsis marcescibilis]
MRAVQWDQHCSLCLCGSCWALCSVRLICVHSRPLSCCLTTHVIPGHRSLNATLDATDEPVDVDTCTHCGGTGIAVVSALESDDEDSDFIDAWLASLSIAASGAAGASAASVAASATAAATPAVVVPAPTPAAPIAGPIPVAGPTLVAPVAAIAPAAAVAPGPAAPPAAPAGPPTVLPSAVSIPIPGFQSLGNTVTPPLPVDAVFTDSGADRFYTVTKGICVGVFGGWMPWLLPGIPSEPQEGFLLLDSNPSGIGNWESIL